MRPNTLFLFAVLAAMLALGAALALDARAALP
jgi:hypothetical protein